MFRDTTKLVDAIRAAQTWLSLLAIQLQDGTATADEQRQAADRIEELMDLLQSHAADVDADIVPAARNLLRTERYPA